ncbi:MAG: hypothetical protein Q9219_006930 [cf. Caloplaca sp. 3 TL-2023]
MDAKMNLLEYLKSKTQVDFDSLDIEMSKKLGPFVDCTSNQMDAYCELIKPNRAALLKKSAALAKELHHDFPAVSVEQLGFEIAMVSLAQTIVPNITGAILVMANPMQSYSTKRIVDNGHRLYRICRHLQPDFDMSRMIVKVPSTWEGLQACRELKGHGVKTLATTVFSMEQAILAAEAGCIYISPFLNELKATVDSSPSLTTTSYHDPSPIWDVCTDSQRYFEQHSYPTRVKACAAVTVEQILQLAGVSAFTATADQLDELAGMEEKAADVMARSIFLGSVPHEPTKGSSTVEQAANGDAPQANGHVENGEVNGNANGDETNGHANGHAAAAEKKQDDKKMEKISFIDDESKYRLAFAKSDEGRGQLKTTQLYKALNLFAEFQIKAEALMRDADLTSIG